MLDNGLTVRFRDETRRYFGNFHHIRIIVHCVVPLTPELTDISVDYGRFCGLVGGEIRYERTLEQMGVSGDDLNQVRQRLVATFVETAVPYLSSPSFPRQLVANRVARLRRQGRLRP
jgi:hypothetical protein